MLEYHGKKLYWHKNLIDMLTYADILLREQRISYWLLCGVLLGAARNGKMIPWDIDIDLGMFFTDINKLLALESRVKKAGYTWKVYKRSYKKVGKIIRKVTLFEPSKFQFHIDFMPHIVKEDKAVMISTPTHYHTLSAVQNLREIEFEGRKFPCSQDYLDWLRREYQDWETPKIQNIAEEYIKKYDPNNTDLAKEMAKYKRYKYKI